MDPRLAGDAAAPDISEGGRPSWYAEGPVDVVPLVVDLDGTVCLADTLAWLRARTLEVGAEAEAGRARAREESKQAEKVYLWEHVGLDLDRVPFDEDLLAELRCLRRSGARLLLVTGSAQGLAEAVQDRWGLFHGVLGGTLEVNLTGPRKAAALVARHGERGFDYLGDSPADIPVWGAARRGYVVWRPTTLSFEPPAEVVRVTSALGVQPPPGREQVWARDDSWQGADPS